MDYRSSIILNTLSKFNGERTVHGVYHLLKGKKTSQTIQDAKLFHADHLFATMRDLTRIQYDNCIKKLVQNTYVTISQDNLYKLTEKGEQFSRNFRNEDRIPKHIQGLFYSSTAKYFWERFSLYVQVLSNVVAGNNKFTPIIINEKAAWWVKKHFPSNYNRAKVSDQLFNECLSLLQQLSDIEATIFTMKLSGSNRIGYTLAQISNDLNMDKQEVNFYFQSSCHFIVAQVMKSRSDYPLLSSFVDEEKNNIMLTKTAQDTKKLLLTGKSIEEVMNIRQLKRSTIEDHVVEIASSDQHFSIDTYVSIVEQQLIRKTIEHTGSKKLKEIKSNLCNDNIPYFKIRLVLAKGGL
ncbi:hypothetical protein CIB95_07170 [Lottiidibacillus patelloidae]|uniref:Helicase Helix-turn-helix domain-containing protein n=1 Tax=Lottiidibacillus patelloidae TaxID=2670334 RepID=A0A263BV79_9BACI|nr:helix-turn-helix domain-containing protein [Lottiidibacillus patelloidae]OZM57237.1 hypothetical protein CIB95_07170 [Lottiidibacillus patelloidae]